MDKGLKFSEIADFLRKRGYIEREPKDHYRVFYEFDVMDFLYCEVTKKFELEYRDGNVEKVIMVQYWFGKTEFKEITTLEELYKSL